MGIKEPTNALAMPTEKQEEEKCRSKRKRHAKRTHRREQPDIST